LSVDVKLGAPSRVCDFSSVKIRERGAKPIGKRFQYDLEAEAKKDLCLREKSDQGSMGKGKSSARNDRSWRDERGQARRFWEANT